METIHFKSGGGEETEVTCNKSTTRMRNRQSKIGLFGFVKRSWKKSSLLEDVVILEICEKV